jgi:ATP-dependent DNA helicase DinG
MLTDELKQTIQRAYTRWLESKGLKARYGQRLMIAEVARTLADADGESPAIAAIEAGTGTGKTMAYSVAAIPVAQALDKTLVIATATVALQEQIVHKDLPDLAANSGLSFSYVLAKGRSRYLCLSKLDTSLAASTDNNPALALYPDEIAAQPDHAALDLMQRLLDELGSGAWDGDRDQWPEMIPDAVWARITTDHAQCTGRRCPHVRQCCFFKARDAIDKVDVIVTNHDLVLADLALGGGAILPDPAETLYVFDEGHHLPDKARDHFASASRLRGTDKWLEQSIKLLASAAGDLGASGGIDRQFEMMPGIIFELRQALGLLRPQIESLLEAREHDSEHYRFEHGLVPEEMRAVAGNLRSGFEELCERLGRACAVVEEALDKNDTGIDRTLAERWYPVLSLLRARADNNRELFFHFSRDAANEKPPRARWIALLDGAGGQLDFELNCSPILAASVLAGNLWSRCAGAVVTSATLTALGKFERFRMRSGLPEETHWAIVPSPFNHAQAGLLSVPPMRADPTDPEQHTAMLIAMLPQLLNPGEGSLVLFASRRQMNDVFEALAPDWQERILTQDSLGKQELLARHRARIDGGDGSVIFGLASFAEGIDLPGDYCRHVVIAKIPFAVPDAPVEAALSEWITDRGGNAFMEVAVPDAALKLVQASGRLLRTEADTGRITLLDKRIVSRQYGRAILDSLPPFRREIAR